MKFSEIERVVGLHKKAYDILLWLKQAARSKPRLLSEDETYLLASGDKCVVWVKRRLWRAFLNDFTPRTRVVSTVSQPVTSATRNDVWKNEDSR
jgi:hypothetical protein